MFEHSFRVTSTADGLSLQVYRASANGAARGLVLIAHGAAEHAGRYLRFARALNAAGFTVYAYDHRGHGASCGPGGLGDFGPGGWDALVADVGQLVGVVRQQHPDLRVALFAHSMGSFAAQQYVTGGAADLDALVLSGSTAWEPRRPGEPRPPFEPNAAFEPARTPYDWLSRDPVEVDRYIADPLCGFEALGERRGGARPRRLGAMLDPSGLARIPKQLPVLLVAGDADPLNRRLEGLHLLERRWREAGVQRIDTLYYPGARHEVLNEINREQVTSDILAWLGRVL